MINYEKQLKNISLAVISLLHSKGKYTQQKKKFGSKNFIKVLTK